VRSRDAIAAWLKVVCEKTGRQPGAQSFELEAKKLRREAERKQGEKSTHKTRAPTVSERVGPDADGGRTIVTEQTSRQCRLCGKSFTRSGMQRHVRACRRKLSGAGDPDALLLALQDRHLSSYWLVLEASPPPPGTTSMPSSVTSGWSAAAT
jgi:hypothetical protein